MSRTLVVLVATVAALSACGTDDDSVSSADLRDRSFEVVRLGELRLDSVELREESTAFLEFGAETLSISGCNRSSGDYRIEDGRFAFEVRGSSDVDCSQAAPNERPIIDLLEGRPTIEVERDRLVFTAADGTTLVAVDGRSTPP